VALELKGLVNLPQRLKLAQVPFRGGCLGLLLIKKDKERLSLCCQPIPLKMVDMAGFELATPCTPCVEHFFPMLLICHQLSENMLTNTDP